MQLTSRAFALLLITAPLLAAAALAPAFAWIAAGWLLLWLAACVADWRLTPRAADWELARRHEERLSLAAWNRVDVTVRLVTGLRPLNVWLRDTPPADFGVNADGPPGFEALAGRVGDAENRLKPLVQKSEKALSWPPPGFEALAGRVGDAENRLKPLVQKSERAFTEQRVLTGHVTPGGESVFIYHVRPPRRGDFAFGDLYLRWDSVLGLLRRQARFPAAGPVKVYPNLVDVRKYDLLLRKNRLWELGLRPTRVLGSGNEFERLRDYQPDDEYRRINWKATARRGKPISAEYQTERSQNLLAVLDVGRMMRSPVGDVAKLDYAVNAVLLLAYVAAQRGDRLGLLTFADRPQSWLAPRGGKGQFYRMLELLYAVQAQPVEPDYRVAFNYLAAKQHKRSLALVFTDLTGSLAADALPAQLGLLRRTHLPLLVTIADPTVNRLARQPVTDSATLYERTVAGQLLDERRLILDRLRRQGVLTLDVAADELSVAVINRYVELKGRGW
jgi:uncharacterized protein (DUF58 family)